MDLIIEYARYILPCLAVLILLGCCSSLFSKRPKTSTVAFLTNTMSGEAIPLHYWETSIGRSNSCDIVLNYETVSRFHAVISRRKDSWIVSDTGSKSGVLVNGNKINKRSEVKDGDTLTFGDMSYYFSAPDFSDDKDKSVTFVSALVSENNGKVFLLENTECTIGRDKSCNIYLNLPTVSRNHAKLKFSNGKWILNNYSSNGVFINGKPVYETQQLRDKDLMDIGGAMIRFEKYFKKA